MNINNFANTIMLTTKCSAKCFHCPFADSKMPIMELSIKKCIELISDAREPLSVISGGEPFEYSYILELLKELTTIKKMFRIATGGHIDLSKFISSLKKLSHLDGVSIGTDVYCLNSPSNILRKIFMGNLKVLEQNNIDYSLTITILNTKDIFRLNTILNLISKKFLKPQFIYLRYNSNINLTNIIKEKSKLVTKVKFITDKI